MVFREGIEPSTSWMSTKRSANELTEHNLFVGAYTTCSCRRPSSEPPRLRGGCALPIRDD
jgi:hypothetical protein